MELLKFFFKDEVPAVGLSKIKEKKVKHSFYQEQKINLNRQIFKPNYSNNFFIL